MTRRRLLLPTLLALTVSAFAQKMQTPAGEAPGPWILGTIGIGPQPYTARKGGAEPAKEMPPGSQIALKGFAIKVGEHGEAAVAYDLDLCRMAGAWVGKFTTPMNLMSRGEYPTALGEVAFTTGEVPGFLTFGSDSGAKKAVFQGKGSAPISGGGAVPASGGGVPPSGGVAAPQGGAPISSGGSAPASGGVGGRAGTAPISRSEAPIPRGGAPFSASDAPAASGDAPAARNSAPAAAGGAPAANGGGIPEAKNGDSPLRDPRPEPFGPLPPGQARFRGFYVNGDKTILKWDIGGVEVLEMPGCENRDGICFFTRSLEVQPSENPIDIYLGIEPEERGEDVSLGEMGLSMIASKESPGYGVLEFMNSNYRNRFYSISIQSEETEHLGLPYDRIFLSPSERILHLLPRKATTRLRFAYWSSSDRQEVAAFREVLFAFGRQVALLHLADLAHGGPARWPEPVVTTGELSKDTASAYVVDTIKLPDPNPWGAPMFVGGFDFFDRGAAATAASAPPTFHPDAAVCTFHGDVFLVSGLDEKLEHVTWKRFASGLYHPLGLKIVNGEIYVTCRDGLWRLHDLNGDGEADFYEAFNFDVKVTKSFHEFVFDLQTDPAGNFYFAKAGPVKNGGRGFDEIMAHHGSLFRVSPDGKKFEVIATGFRAPNGLGVGPHGELTSGDNEGTWTPVCRLNWITPGGFYGVVPLSHRDPLPTSYDPPLCWLPKRVDNSSGSQVWAPEGERWGPWGGKMLHLSYGQAALYGVLVEEVGSGKAEVGSAEATAERTRSDFRLPTSHFVQGGVTKFPLQFQSGIMRARFNPADGQLYVAGLRGWQTSGLKNGCFQRVRYTGAETRMPIELHVKKDGIELRFTTSLATQTARDPENWHLEQWRYLWSAAYGSPELSTETDPEAPAEAGNDGAAQFTKAQMSVAKHDPVIVKTVTIGTDDRTVFLEIPGLKPVMQMSIKYDLKTADGKELRGEVVNTIHALGGG